MHTSAHSPDSVLKPHRACERALDLGISVIALTDHDHVWSHAEIDQLRARYERLAILRGVEVSLVDSYHAVVIGEDFKLDAGPPLTPAQLKARLDACARPSFCFVAHPFYHTPERTAELDALLRFVNGIECNSPYCCEKGHLVVAGRKVPLWYADALKLCSEFRVPALFNSDSHHEGTLGTMATKVDLVYSGQDEFVVALKAAVTSLVQDL
nr:PHP domain-containing protein [Desulfolutivibrio sulfodismutans]